MPTNCAAATRRRPALTPSSAGAAASNEAAPRASEEPPNPDRNPETRRQARGVVDLAKSAGPLGLGPLHDLGRPNLDGRGAGSVQRLDGVEVAGTRTAGWDHRLGQRAQGWDHALADRRRRERCGTENPG